MKTNQLSKVKYLNKNSNETTVRTIIPTSIPSNNVKALDVTDLSSEQQNQLVDLVNEYQEYIDQQIASLFSFDNWLSHSKGEHFSAVPHVKWRTFALVNLEELS